MIVSYTGKLNKFIKTLVQADKIINIPPNRLSQAICTCICITQHNACLCVCVGGEGGGSNSN